MNPLRAFIGRHKRFATVASVVSVAGLVFVIVWFQPQKLFLNRTVREPLPALEAPVETPGAIAPSATPRPAISTIASGPFRSLEHATTGTARLVQLADGRFIVRLEDLRTSDGPDVRVYLSSVPSDRGQNDYGDGYVDLGALKGNRGDANYAVPLGTDPAKFQTVVLWCRRFKVGFGVAPLR